MSEAFNSHSMSIGQLMGPTSSARLVVPAFQRGYSWEKKHVDAFWNDVIGFMDESQKKDGPDKYFLGPIVVIHRGKEMLALLDGQQRMATATILMCVMRDVCRSLGIVAGNDFARDIQRQFVLNDDGDEDYSLVLGDLDRSFFSDTIQRNEPIARQATIRSHRLIQSAQVQLRTSLTGYLGVNDQLGAVAKAKKLFRAIRTDFVVASIPVESERDAFRIFETLNDRGLRLSVPDLLLNFLMRAAQDDQRSKLRDVWNDMVYKMGRRDISRFMRHMWISKYGDLKTTDLFSALRARIENSNINSLDFTQECAEECSRYAALMDTDEEQFTAGAIPIVKNIVKRFDFQAAYPMLLSAMHVLDKDSVEKVARWLLVFLVRYSIIANLNSSTMESILYKLARDIRERGPAGAGQCLAHVKQTLIEASPLDDQVSLSAKTLWLGPTDASYLLSRLATHLQSKTKELALSDANLEHIYPRNPDVNEWGEDVVDTLEPLLWHIGNLTMLGTRLNAGVGNKKYATKRQHYEKSELEITRRVATNYQAWGVHEILTRGAELAPLVLEIWNFDNPSRV